MLKFLLVVVLLAAVGFGGAWWWAGRMSGPAIDLKQPGRFVGQSTSLDLTLQAPEGRFSQIHVASEAPKIASGNRLTGTPEEYAGIMRRSLSVFGTWTVDEANKTVTYNIVSSSFPNWEGEAQTRNIDKLTDDEFVNTNPNVAGGRGSASNLYKRVK